MNEIYPNTIVIRNQSIITVFHDRGATLLSIDAGSYFDLNQTGSCVWQLIANPCAVEKIVRELLQLFEEDRVVIENDLKRLIQMLGQRGLVQIVSHEETL